MLIDGTLVELSVAVLTDKYYMYLVNIIYRFHSKIIAKNDTFRNVYIIYLTYYFNFFQIHGLPIPDYLERLSGDIEKAASIVFEAFWTGYGE